MSVLSFPSKAPLVSVAANVAPIEIDGVRGNTRVWKT